MCRAAYGHQTGSGPQGIWPGASAKPKASSISVSVFLVLYTVSRQAALAAFGEGVVHASRPVLGGFLGLRLRKSGHPARHWIGSSLLDD